MKLIKSTTLILCMGVSACSSFQGTGDQAAAPAKPGNAQASTATSGSHWWWPFGGSDIRWNFTKYLIDASGRPSVRYAPTMEPELIAPAIERLLRASAPVAAAAR